MKTLSDFSGAHANRAQLKLLADRFYKPLFSYFAKRLPADADADDYVQEVFLRLSARENLSMLEKPEGYIFQTAANLLRDRARRAVRRSSNKHEHFVEDAHGHEEISPERVLMGKQDVDAFAAALAALPARTRAVFLLRRFEHMRYGEIARRLGVSVSSVEKHMAKAVKRLEGCLDGTV